MLVQRKKTIQYLMEEPLLSRSSHIPFDTRKTYPTFTLLDPTFSYVNPILDLANSRGSIDNSDLYFLPPQYSSDLLMEKYMEIYRRRRSILGALTEILGLLGVVMIFMVFVSTLLQYADPLLLKYMIRYISDPSSEASSFLYILIGIGLFVLVLRTLCEQHAIHITYLCSVKTINCIFGLLYSKTLRISNAAKSLLGSGKIMNILHGDGKVVAGCVDGFNELWTTPIEIGVSLWLLYREIQWYSFMGACIIGLGIVVQKLVYDKYTIIRRKMYKYADGRSRYLNEYLEGIKIIKCNAWEDFSYANVKKARKHEVGLQFKAEMLKVVNEIMIPLLMILTILIIYLWEGQALNSEKTFTVLALYKKLESPLRSISSVFSWYAKFRLSLQRITLYMKTPESIQSIPYHVQTQNMNKSETQLIGKYSPPFPPGEVKLYNCTYAWVDRKTINHAEKVHTLLKKGRTGKTRTATAALAKFSTAPCLQDINLHIKKGELVAVVGEIGSGKTAFLQGIIGELIRIRGCEEIGGTVRYVPQVPWIIYSTMEHNIRLERLEHASTEDYKKIFIDCDLDVDVRQFPEKDQVVIGARGANLSGGQRARVGIAREVYADGDVFLFDDCLAALDPQVASKIFTKVILNGLSGKTRIFVTHAFHLAALVPRIIVLKDGKVVEQGTYKELIKMGGEFSRLQSGAGLRSISVKEVVDKLSSPKPKRKAKQDKVEYLHDGEKAPKKKDVNLINKEAKSVGSISWKYYMQLLKYGGLWMVLWGALAFFAVDVLMALIQWWLAMWTANKFDEGIWYYTTFYLIFSFLYCLSLFIRKFIVSYFQYNISFKSQTELVNILLHTPLSWFAHNPVGRIVNRGVKDQSIVDYLGTAIANSLQKTVSLLVTFFVIGMITPYFLILLCVLIALYLYWYNYSIQAARDARRLNSINHSPMYGIFNEILDGLINIRLANLETMFMDRQHNYLDISARSYIFKAYCSRWINFRIEILGAFAVAGASIFLALEKGVVLGSLAGFSLLNSISIAEKLGSLLLSVTDVETSMSSMERICEYIYQNPQEKSYYTPPPGPKVWPFSGKLEIQNLSIRYQPDARLALANVNFKVAPGEKVGVVGRTGSGKSTLTLALLRILEPVHISSDKTIIIDDVDVEQIGLKYLRAAIGIIGQEPVLFSGTVRNNLDPFDQHTDKELVQALDKVRVMPLLKKKLAEEKPETGVGEYNGGYYFKLQKDAVLELTVRERGENFSLGERQLICLARTLVKHPKVLIMDEATASVDEATDWKIHKMIRKEFKSTTVLIIAHRVKNLLECDKILVLEEGKAVDFDTPRNLIKKKAGFFYESLQQSISGKTYQNLFKLLLIQFKGLSYVKRSVMCIERFRYLVGADYRLGWLLD
eukprot:TRINITY_DN105059_c1_g1_i1.p1 TRINITY_DN105059_c1_g1~~TRINITY_DN105059_c1_g1_i1.p1  ORF type:complete len:1385 (+),score=125.11 TRINITY_DN105059_c1_g1_i1:140-4294(+)